MKTISLSFRLETFQFHIAWEKNVTESNKAKFGTPNRTTGAGTVIVSRVELFNLQGPPSRNRDNNGRRNRKSVKANWVKDAEIVVKPYQRHCT